MNKCVFVVLCALFLCKSEGFSNKSDLEGMYVGAGVSCRYLRSNMFMDDNMSQLASFADHPAEYGDLAGYYCEPDIHGLSLIDSSVTQVGGNISFGFGGFLKNNFWFTDNVFIGIGFDLDISKSSKITVTKNKRENLDFGECSIQFDKVIPTVVLRFGGYLEEIDSLGYVRLGITRIGYKIKQEFFPNQDIRSAVITPVLGIGLEKNISDSFSLKVEADYIFNSTKTHNLKGGHFVCGPIEKYKAKVKSSEKGYTLRLTGVFHF